MSGQVRGFTHRPALLLALAFALGAGLQHVLGPWPLLPVICGVFFVGMLVARRGERGAGVALSLMLLCGSYASWNAALLPLDHVAFHLEAWRGRDMTIVGQVVSVPVCKTEGLAPRTVFAGELESVEGHPVKGRVLVHFFAGNELGYGDRFEASGKLSRPFEFFDQGRSSYRAYLARQGVHALFYVRKHARHRILEKGRGPGLQGAALAVRVHLQAVFDRYLSPGESGLMKAMLLGPRDDIPPHVYDIFRKTGTAHIIAISGMNMTLTAVGVVLFLGIMRVPRFPRAILAALIIGFYSFVAGNSAPVARSALMAAAVILSFVIERETDVFNSLGLAGLVLLAVDPGQLTDAGCQLSFVCVASIVLLTPMILMPFEEWGWRERRVLWFFIESAAVTLAAFIGSAGILAYYFGFVTPIGLVVNLPVIPLMALVTALGAAVLAAGMAAPFIVMPFALCLKVLLNGVVGLLSWAAQAPAISCSHIPVWMAAFYYVLLAAGVWFFHRTHARPVAAAFIDKPIAL